MTTHTETQEQITPLPWASLGREVFANNGQSYVADFKANRTISPEQAEANSSYAMRAANSFPALLAALEQLTDYAEAARDVLKQTEHKRLLDDTCTPIVAARAAIAAAKAP